jgi:hypothetical protein
MKLNHFSEAKMIIDRCKKIAPTHSIVLFRSALITALNLTSSIENLTQAQEELAQGVESKKTEKVFQHEPNLLKMVGLDNHVTVFADLEKFINSRMAEIRLQKEERIRSVVERVKQINEVEQRIIDEGKIPEDGPSIYRMFGSEDDDMEHFILNE